MATTIKAERPADPAVLTAIKAIPGVKIGKRVDVPIDAWGSAVAAAREAGGTIRNVTAIPPPKPAPVVLPPESIHGLREGRAEWLTEYQRETVDASTFRPGLMLFHAAGAGKTTSAVACAQQQSAGRVVVVTLATHKRFWKREIDHLCEAGVQVVDGMTPVLFGNENVGPRYIVTNWEILAAHSDALCDLDGGIGTVIFDEIHRAKDPRGKWMKAARKLSRRGGRVLGLTASPIPDRIRDLWGQLDLISKGAFGSFWEYCFRYCDAKEAAHPGGTHLDTSGKSNVAELRARWAHYCHRVAAERSHAALPPIRRVVHFIPVQDLLADRGKSDAQPSSEGAVSKATTWFEAKVAKASYRKRPQVVALCEEVVGNGGKAVVLTGRHKDVEAIAASVQKAIPDAKVWAVHGGNSTPAEVDDAVLAYMATEEKALIVGTGEQLGTGKNLQDSDALIQAMLPWNQGQVDQREGRVYRLGMKRRPQVHYLVAEGTVDERISEILLSKLPAYGDAVGEAGAMDLADALKGLGDEEATLSLLMQWTVDRPLEQTEVATQSESARAGADEEAHEENESQDAGPATAEAGLHPPGPAPEVGPASCDSEEAVEL